MKLLVLLALGVFNFSVAANISVDYSGAQLGPQVFANGYFEKFESSIAQKIKESCPKADLSLKTELEDWNSENLLDFRDFIISNKSGKVLFKVETMFYVHADGLQNVDIDAFTKYSCEN